MKTLSRMVLLISLAFFAGLIGCGGGGGSGSNPLSPDVSQLTNGFNFPAGSGNGTANVRLNKIAAGHNSINMQILVSGISDASGLTAKVLSKKGGEKVFDKVIKIGNNFALVSNSLDIAGLMDFDSITFSRALPVGVKVEIVNNDVVRAAAKSIRASTYDFSERMDYNDDGVVDSNDIIIFMAWYQAEPKTIANVEAYAQDLWADVALPIQTLPDVATDDLNGDGFLNSEDAAILIAWYQVEDPDAILPRAIELFPGVGGVLVNLPAELVKHTVILDETVSGLNNFNLQIHITGVPSDYDTSAYLECSTVSTPSAFIRWSKSSTLIATDGIILLCSTIEPYSVNPFDRIDFTVVLPVGANVKIVNKDNQVALIEKRILPFIVKTWDAGDSYERIGVDGNGNIYLSGGAPIRKYDGDGNFLLQFASDYSFVGIDGANNSYCGQGSAIYKFFPDGSLAGEVAAGIESPFWAADVDLWGNLLLVSQDMPYTVNKIEQNGDLVASWSALEILSDIRADPDGNVWVTSQGSDLYVGYYDDGGVLLGSYSEASYQLSRPIKVSFGPDGSVYILCKYGPIQKMDSSLNLLYTFDFFDFDNTNISIRDISVTQDGYLYGITTENKVFKAKIK